MQLVPSFAASLQPCAALMTAPTFGNLQTIVTGWLFAERRTVTGLTFTPANWNVPQLVTLTALDDVDVANGQATFRLGAAGWPSLDVTATEVDNDLRLLATPLSITVPEGGTQTCSVRLAGQPAGSVVVSTGRVRGDSSLRVTAGGSLTFTPANWNSAQLVTIYALPDSDTINGQATFRVISPGWPSVDVTVTEQEPVSAGLSFAPPPSKDGDS